MNKRHMRYSAVNCGAVVHEEGNAIVRIKCERV